MPTHGPSCQTWLYSTACWHCGAPIHVLQCTCGSVVLLNRPQPPWPEHTCSGGIGGSGLSGWAAVDVLRANGVPIVASILDKVFPPSATKRTSKLAATEETKAIKPVGGEQRSLLAMVRDLMTETKRTERLGALGDVGTKLLRLPKGPLWQVTLVVNSERPNLTYTCILPQRLGLPKNAKDKLIFAQIEGRVAGEHAIWLVTDARVI